MLWKKESSNQNALYVDLFDRMTKQKIDTVFPQLNREPAPKKSAAISLEKRKEGNVLFGNGKWAEAMEKYNESLCFAPTGSENISMAYANRAACFLRLKLYNECLIDIDLARNAGYPIHLMPKLDQRENDCLMARDASVPQDDYNLKLSFEPDTEIPCMANVLKIERNRSGEVSVVAKGDIDVGQTVVLGKPFCAYLHSRFALKCNICLKDNTNLMPCKLCTNAMFCSDECRGNDLHEHECGRKVHDVKQQNAQYLNELRVLLMTINMFPNIDELMDFVINSLSQREVPISLTDDRSKYRAFLKFPISTEFAQSPNTMIIIYSIYKVCQSIPKVAAKFSSLKHRRFLMHLISHHAQITNFNSNHVRNNESEDFYNQIGLMTKYFKHSCSPNVLMSERDGISIYTTIRPIQKGDELFITYFGFLLMPKHVRQQTLWFQAHIRCKCSRCVGQVASLPERQQLTMDPDFQLILSSASKLSPYDKQKIEETMERCVAFLKKYGEINWCEEIGKVVDVYMQTMISRIPRPMYT